jgi:hypothetical protein
MLCEEVTNTNFIVFDLTRSGLDPKIYRPRGEHASHYTYHVPSVNTRIDQPMEHYINLGCLGEYHVPSVNTRIDQPMEHYIDLGCLGECSMGWSLLVFTSCKVINFIFTHIIHHKYIVIIISKDIFSIFPPTVNHIVYYSKQYFSYIMARAS